MNAPNAMEQTAMAMPGLGGPANEAPSPIAPAADRDQRTAVGRGQVVATYAAAVRPTSVAASPWYATKGIWPLLPRSARPASQASIETATPRTSGVGLPMRSSRTSTARNSAVAPLNVMSRESSPAPNAAATSGTTRNIAVTGRVSWPRARLTARGSTTACGAVMACCAETVRFDVDVDVAFRREAVGFGAVSGLGAAFRRETAGFGAAPGLGSVFAPGIARVVMNGS